MGNIIIGADFVPTAKNQDLFREGNTEELLGAELCAVLENADYRICNMEVPLTDEKTPIRKCGPALSAPTSAIHGYKALRFDLVTLANNHIMDQGAQGLASTRRLLAENGIAYVGAGDSLREAAEPVYFSFAGKKIGTLRKKS